MALPRVRRTVRLAEAQRRIALHAGGESGARLANRLAMPVSGDTLLRLIRAAPLPVAPSPRVVGIDDWAWRRGRRYGTLIVDLERSRPIDLLPGRDGETVATWLKAHELSSGKLGITGFCWGGTTTNTLAVALGAEVKAAVPFYGAAPETAGVPSIKAPLLIHYAEKDERINAMWPAYEAALKANGIPYEAFIYPGTQHGFHNNSTPRYDEAAAKLAWDRTLAHFRKNLA